MRKDSVVQICARSSDPNSVISIRQTAVNADGSIVLSVNQEGVDTIWKKADASAKKRGRPRKTTTFTASTSTAKKHGRLRRDSSVA